MSESPKKINKILDEVYLVSSSIGLNFNLNKCKSFFRGQHKIKFN